MVRLEHLIMLVLHFKLFHFIVFFVSLFMNWDFKLLWMQFITAHFCERFLRSSLLQFCIHFLHLSSSFGNLNFDNLQFLLALWQFIGAQWEQKLFLLVPFCVSLHPYQPTQQYERKIQNIIHSKYALSYTKSKLSTSWVWKYDLF